MFGVLKNRLAFGLVVVFLFGALPAGAADVHAGSPAYREPSERWLQDGMDAAIDGNPTGARRIFEKLIAVYPRSDAARKADGELAKLAAAARDDAEDDPAAGADNGDQLRKVRFRFVSEIGDRVFFAENSAVIGGRARAILEAQARWLKNAPQVDVTILGRADDGGSATDAEVLSQKRAEAVQAKLVEAGLPAARIKIEAHGSGDPVATCRSALCQAENRHAETLLRYSDYGPSETGYDSANPPASRGADAARGPGRPMAQ